jgi:hypothetical protein
MIPEVAPTNNGAIHSPAGHSRRLPNREWEDCAAHRAELGEGWKGYRPGSELFCLAFPKAKHDENAWAERSPVLFQFLFGNLPAFEDSATAERGNGA